MKHVAWAIHWHILVFWTAKKNVLERWADGWSKSACCLAFCIANHLVTVKVTPTTPPLLLALSSHAQSHDITCCDRYITQFLPEVIPRWKQNYISQLHESRDVASLHFPFQLRELPRALPTFVVTIWIFPLCLSLQGYFYFTPQFWRTVPRQNLRQHILSHRLLCSLVSILQPSSNQTIPPKIRLLYQSGYFTPFSANLKEERILCNQSHVSIYLRHMNINQSQWPRGLRYEPSSPAGTLGSWVRTPLEV
jgi:hypothetical protein